MTRSARVAEEPTWKWLFGTLCHHQSKKKSGSALTKRPQLGDTTDTRTE
jgi:hypothetical protein